MKRTSTILLLLLMVGCSTPPSMTYVERLRNTTIPSLELRDVSVDGALDSLRAEWQKQMRTDMPVARVTQFVKDEHGASLPVTFRAQHISFLDALRIISLVSGSVISYRENNFLITDISPYDYTPFNFELNSTTKDALGLGNLPSVGEVQKALSIRGADLSKGHLTISFLDSERVLVCGPADDVRIAEAIVALSIQGYEIRKKNASQP